MTAEWAEAAGTIAAAIISICALVLTIKFAHTGWKHERLASQAFCHFEIVKREFTGKKAGISIVNQGPGIGRISDWMFSWDNNDLGGQEIHFDQARNKIKEICLAAAAPGKVIKIGRGWHAPGQTLSINSTYRIIWLEEADGDEAVATAFSDSLDRMKIKVTVASIYGDKFVDESR